MKGDAVTSVLRIARAALAAALLVGVTGSFAPALAYDPNAAAAHAEAHWNECGVGTTYP
jgi:Spy/CpxP family protein refolding chaperone